MDQDLRALERQATGDQEAQATWLHARVRAGQLETRRLKQAAYLGDAASRLVVPNCYCWSGREDTRNYHVWGNCGDQSYFRQWAKGLANSLSEEVECGNCDGAADAGVPCSCDGTGKVTRSVPDREFLVRCAVAAAQSIPCPHDEGSDLRACSVCINVVWVIEAAEAWLACPCKAHWTALHARCGVGSGVRGAGLPEWAWLTTPVQAIQAAAQLTSPGAVRKAIRERVAPWLLQ